MIVAATRNLLHPVHPRNNVGYLREKAIVRQLAREGRAEVAKLRFSREVGAAQFVFGDNEGEIFKHYRDSSNKELLRFMGHVQPWMDWEAVAARQESEAWAQDTKTWEDSFGDLDDPQTQADVEALAAFLRSPPDPAAYAEEM